jgi:hypothetical protein
VAIFAQVGVAPEPAPTAPPAGAPADAIPAAPAVMQAGMIAVADTKSTEGTSVYPQVATFVFALIAIVAGAVLGTILYDASKATFDPPEGVGIFALFYIAAQLIERLQEPLAPFLGRTSSEPAGGGSQVDQNGAKAELASAVAGALSNPSEAMATEVANKKRTGRPNPNESYRCHVRLRRLPRDASHG